MPNDTTTQAPAPPSGDQALAAASQQVAQPHTALPAPMPQMPTRIRSASGLLGMLTADITNAYAAHKEKKIKDAMANYMTYANAHTRAEDMVNKSGETDPAKRQQMLTQFVSKDPSVVALFSGKNGEKNVKAMRDLLKVDFSDPESMNTVQHQALQRVTKILGVQKVMAMLGAARQQHAQMSQGQGQQDQLPARVAARGEAQATPLPTDVKGATDVAKSEAELTTARANMLKAQQDIKNKYDFKVDQSGQWLALDKQTGKGAAITDENGKPLTGQVKVGAGEGKVAMVENVPYGITHTALDGRPQIITPDMPEWTPKDAKIFEAAKAAAAAGEANKLKLANMRATFFSSLPQGVLLKVDDPQKGLKAGELAFVTRQEAAAHPEKYAPVGSGDKALGMQARFGEIQRTVDMTNQAIENLPDDAFDAKARAQVAYVLRSPDPASALDAFFKSGAADTLNDKQIDYVTSLTSLAESAQALTSLQGIGARGSDKLRAAITAMLPSGSTPSQKYAKVQMKKFQVELDALLKGVPTLGALSGTGPTAPSGTVTFTDAGVTYDIPKEKVPAFKKAHPNATTAK